MEKRIDPIFEMMAGGFVCLKLPDLSRHSSHLSLIRWVPHQETHVPRLSILLGAWVPEISIPEAIQIY